MRRVAVCVVVVGLLGLFPGQASAATFESRYTSSCSSDDGGMYYVAWYVRSADPGGMAYAHGSVTPVEVGADWTYLANIGYGGQTTFAEVELRLEWPSETVETTLTAPLSGDCVEPPPTESAYRIIARRPAYDGAFLGSVGLRARDVQFVRRCHSVKVAVRTGLGHHIEIVPSRPRTLIQVRDIKRGVVVDATIGKKC
jgi:hypothetical protein